MYLWLSSPRLLNHLGDLLLMMFVKEVPETAEQQNESSSKTEAGEKKPPLSQKKNNPPLNLRKQILRQFFFLKRKSNVLKQVLQEAKDVYKYRRPPKKYRIYFKKMLSISVCKPSSSLLTFSAHLSLTSLVNL